MDKIKITKIEAARRQLEMAISLWFNEEDFVSTHTIAMAAYQVLADLCKKNKNIKTIKEGVIEIGAEISESLKNRMAKELNLAQNFFKHADRDSDYPNSFIYYKPVHTETFIWEACSLYNKLTGEMTVPMRIMNIWVYMKIIDKLTQQSDYEQMIIEFRKNHLGETKKTNLCRINGTQ